MPLVDTHPRTRALSAGGFHQTAVFALRWHCALKLHANSYDLRRTVLPTRPHGARCVAEVDTVARRHFDKRCRHADTFRLRHAFYQQFTDGISLALTRSSGNPLDLPATTVTGISQRYFESDKSPALDRDLV